MAAAIGAAVVAVGGWGTVATVALTVASMAYSYSVAKKAKNAASGDPAERKQILRSSSAPKNYIYGQVRSSGVLVFAQEEEGDQTDNEWVHLALTHAGHKIEWAGDVYLNDETSANFPDHCKIAHYPEGRTTSDPYLLSKCKDWSDKMIGKDFAWMRVSLKFSQEKFPSGLPNINALKKGFKVPNLETGAVEWSDNPALCILHFLRLKGWEDEYLILDTFKEAARICDDLVQNSDGTSSRRYAIGCEFDDSDTPASVLEKMLATCGGEWVRVGGRLGLRVAAYYGPAFINITEDDIIDGIEIQPEVERSDSFNIVRGTFVSPEQNYTEIDYPEVKVAQWVADDQEEIIMDMDLNYVQNPWQAQRLADIALKRARLGMTLKLPCNMRAFQATPGTMINLSLATIGFVKEEFMVVDWDFSIDGGVNLIVRRDMPSFYDDAVGKPIVTPPIIDLPLGGVPAPTNPLYTAKPVGDIVQGIVSWTNTAFQLSHTNVIVKDSHGFIIQSAQIPFPGNDMELNGKLAGSYEIELQSFGVNGRASTVTQMDIVISAPTTPDTVSIKASNWSIHLIPSYAIGTVPFGTLFEFYASTTDEADAPTRKPDEVASSWNQGGLIPDTNYYYWIRAVNSYGKSGWVKKTARTTAEAGLVETLVERLVAVEIVSSNFEEGKTGYKIYGPQDPAKDGSAEFNDIIARGDLYANSLTFLPGSTIPPEIDNSKVPSAANPNLLITGNFGDSPLVSSGDTYGFHQQDMPSLKPGDVISMAMEGRTDGTANLDLRMYIYASDWSWSANFFITDASYVTKTLENITLGGSGDYKVGFYKYPASIDAGSVRLRQCKVEMGSSFTGFTGSATDSMYPNQSSIQIKSGNYTPGQKGWAIDSSGTAEFRQVVVRGDGYFDDGWFKGTVYASKISGDVVTAKVYSASDSVVIGTNGWSSWKVFDSVTVKTSSSRSRQLVITVSHEITLSEFGDGPLAGQVRITGSFGTVTAAAVNIVNNGPATLVSREHTLIVTVPAGSTGTMSIQHRAYGEFAGVTTKGKSTLKGTSGTKFLAQLLTAGSDLS